MKMCYSFQPYLLAHNDLLVCSFCRRTVMKWFYQEWKHSHLLLRLARLVTWKGLFVKREFYKTRHQKCLLMCHFLCVFILQICSSCRQQWSTVSDVQKAGSAHLPCAALADTHSLLKEHCQTVLQQLQ